uniref:PRA1 family protein n=1 Tax=Anthurium amnicola TaxID=1678845 RepID=A0A1D1YYW8_9ARAE
MTTYGAIPTASPSHETGLEFLSRAKERGRAALATRRPWREMVHRHAFGVPHGIGDAYLRIRTNAGYFTMNYAIVVLVVLFLSLIWHPLSLVVFVVMMAVWLFLYFLRDEPLVLFHRTIGDRVVLIVLSVVTLAALLLTHATVNILVSVLLGLALVLVHAAFRKTDDLFLEEEASRPGGGWYSVIGETAGRPSGSP